MNILLAALLAFGYVFGASLISASIFNLWGKYFEFVNICFLFSAFLPIITKLGARSSAG